ncbi:hypothetical protein FBUS_00851, partial [Fasciolopsis buskii]
FSSTHGLLPLSLWCRIPLKIDGTFLDLLGDTLDDSEIPPGLRELAKAGVPDNEIASKEFGKKKSSSTLSEPLVCALYVSFSNSTTKIGVRMPEKEDH